MLLFKCKTSDILLFQWYSILKTILFHLWLALTCFLKLALECFFTAQYWQEYSTPSRWVLSKCSIIWLCRKNQSKLSFSISLINKSRHAGFYFLMLFIYFKTILFGFLGVNFTAKTTLPPTRHPGHVLVQHILQSWGEKSYMTQDTWHMTLDTCSTQSYTRYCVIKYIESVSHNRETV